VKRASAQRAAGGFTLIEVLVALTVMAVLAGLAWRGVDGMLRARELTEASIARSSRLNTVLTQLRQDLESLVDPATMRVTPAALEFDGRSLRLVRAEGQSLRIVAWTLHDGVWLRWMSPPVTRIGELQEQWFRSLQLLGNEPEQVKLLEGVDDVVVVCRAQTGNRYNCQSSGVVPVPGQPPSAQRTEVPRALEVSITIGGQKLERLLLTAING
jgi:general secretion pathway protein J